MPMSYKSLYRAWAVLFAVTAALGFIPEPEGWLDIGMKILTAAFFVPGFWIVYKAKKEGSVRQRKLVRGLCLCAIGAAAVLLPLNLMSAGWSDRVGTALHAMLTVACAPMVCGGGYLLSLFLWGCLLMDSIRK